MASRKDDWHEEKAPLIDNIGKYIVFFGILFFLMILSIIPLHFGILNDMRPPFMLMAIYYWAIYRPQVMSTIMVFCFGLALDLLLHTPFGLTAAIFVLALFVTKAQRRFLNGQSFIMVWWGYCLVSSGAAFLHWAAFSILYFELMPYENSIASTLLGICLFPFIMRPMHLSNSMFHKHDMH